MKKALYLFLVVSFTILNCSNPPEKQWFKGNLHTHSYWSDGDEFPETIMEWYKTRNYDFVALSDHNTLAEGEKWKLIRPDSVYQASFQKYLAKYGEEWVTWKEDEGEISVKLKAYSEYKELFEEEGEFLVIRSQEITDGFEGNPLHMNATNIQKKIEPRHGESVVDVLQNNINAVLEQRKETGEPMIPHVNHPNFYYAITWEEMAALEGERFFEVYNGHHMVHNSGDSTHISTEEMWDRINISYLADGKPLMYGLATDDSHNYHHHGKEFSNAGRGWIMVEADSLNPHSLIEAMERGNFYGSTGVSLENASFDGTMLSVLVKTEPGVDYRISFHGAREGSLQPETFETIEGTEASFQLTDDIQFVRAKITSDKLQANPIEDIIYETAWTQPVVKD